MESLWKPELGVYRSQISREGLKEEVGDNVF